MKPGRQISRLTQTRSGRKMNELRTIDDDSWFNYLMNTQLKAEILLDLLLSLEKAWLWLKPSVASKN